MGMIPENERDDAKDVDNDDADNDDEDVEDEDDDDNVGVSRPSANHAYCRRNILNLDWS